MFQPPALPKEQFKLAKETLKPVLEHKVWSPDMFFSSIHRFFHWKDGVYEDKFEDNLHKKLGSADWDIEMYICYSASTACLHRRILFRTIISLLTDIKKRQNQRRETCVNSHV